MCLWFKVTTMNQIDCQVLDNLFAMNYHAEEEDDIYVNPKVCLMFKSK